MPHVIIEGDPMNAEQSDLDVDMNKVSRDEHLDKVKKQLDSLKPSQKERMLQFFSYEHLPEHLQQVSKPFCDLAFDIVKHLPSNPERVVCLRKLLEAKDCAVRALLFKD